jgi:hypothetical protein
MVELSHFKLFSHDQLFHWFILIFLLFLPHLLFSQDRSYEKTMSLKQFIEEIQNSTEKDSIGQRIVFHSVKFELRNNAEDSIFLKEISRPGLITNLEWSPDELNLDASLVFFNCQFDGRYTFVQCNFSNVEFIDCHFSEPIRFRNCLFKGNLNFLSCNYDLQNVYVEDCVFERSATFNNSTFNNVHFNKNTFETNSLSYYQLRKKYNDYWIADNGFPPLAIRISQIKRLDITDSKFKSVNEITGLAFAIESSSIDYFRFLGDTISSISLNNTSFNKLVEFDSTEISNNIFTKNAILPSINTNIAWNYIKGNKISDQLNNKIYKAKNENQLSNTFSFYNLISSYKSFHQIYKSRGDRESANECFVEMKDLETRRLAFLNKENPTLYTWFNWKLNQFLKFFCDYGTNPIKSLIISMWTILGFALFYFFFYSDWDKINRTFLIKQHRKLMEYFRSEQTIQDFYIDSYKSHVTDYKDYKTELEESKVAIPYFIRILGKPLFHLSLIRYNIMNWLYQRTEILHGKWINLKSARKIFVGMIVGFAILLYGAYLVTIRALNSTILSINTFSTLGFGDIPVKGITRYIAILEGFIGWFLLSIFSVSLISQILQN